MKKNRFFRTLIISVLVGFSFFACKVGLGEAVDIVGPEVTITSPGMRDCVSDNFTISGTAYDKFGVTSLTVTLDENEWKNEKGVWSFKEKGSKSYVPYADAKWEVQGDKKIIWSISNVNVTTQGKQLLVVSALDEAGNTSANSQKKITIILDNTPPKVALSSPNIKYTKIDDIKNYFGTIVDYKQIQIVNNLITGGFTVAGTTSDENSVDYVIVYINAVDELTGETTEIARKNLVLSSSSEKFQNAIKKESLRSWSVDITDDDLASLGNGKAYLQIATECSDISGNKDNGIYTHGYILLWKDANNPWLTLNISDSPDADKISLVYSGSSIQGIAFDNNQISKVLLTVKTKVGDEWTGDCDGFTEKEVYHFDAVAADGETTQSVGFQVTYPNEVGDYKIMLKVFDLENNESDEAVGYIHVQDKTYPDLNVSSGSLPFGDEDGNITINVTAYDDTKVVKVLYVESSSPDYFQKSDDLWDESLPAVNVLTITPDGIDSSNPNFVRKQYKGSFTFNLFDDKNIGMESGKDKLKTRTFIFFVVDGEGNKTIRKFVCDGDSNEPSVTLDKIDNSELPYLIPGTTKEAPLPGFKGDFNISGTWKEDSYDAWKDGVNSTKPKIVAKVNSIEVNVTVDDETWSATVPYTLVSDAGSLKGAMDIYLEITDIGENTKVYQKGFQIDTNEPRLEYISCDVPSGTYAPGKEIVISLHFNRNVTVDGTPKLNLNNGETIDYVTGSDTKKLDFKYKVSANASEDVTGLKVSGASLNGATIKADELPYETLEADVSSDDMGKTINIITSTPSYESHTWDDSEKTLTIVFSGLVEANTGTITITQDEDSLLVPAYLAKDEYNSMPENVKSYYKGGTAGADEDFKSDLTTKYILDYETNTNDTTLRTNYIATNSHKRTVNILSEKVTRTQDTSAKTTTFVLDVGDLPCLGATYSFDIPANLVKNEAGTKNAASSGKTFTAKGIEAPIIRIYKPQQEVTGCSDSSAGSVEHALSTTFKIDCRTPGVSLNYSYDCLVASKCSVSADGGMMWGGTSGQVDQRQEEFQLRFVYNGTTYFTNLTKKTEGTDENKDIHTKPTITPVKNNTYSKASASYDVNSEVNIGKNGNNDIDYTNGLTYQITATASKTGEPSVSAYEVAYRTTLVLAGYNGIYNGAAGANYDYWPKNNNVAIFIRGSDNLEGANSTSGLPASWNINEKDKIVMLKRDGNDFYFTTWNITVDKFYHQPLAGICDSKTNTAGEGNNQEPSYSIFQQDNIIFALDKYPVGKGEYMEVSHGGRYDLSVPGKVMNHR